MKNTPIPAEIVDKKVAESGISSVGKASIREVKRLINEIEQASGKEFVRMEMGIPGLPPCHVGVEAQIEALKKGVAAIYPDIEGIPALKQEAARFVKNFIDLEVEPENCIPTVGSMMGGMAGFMTFVRCRKERDTTLFIDPGFPVQKQQHRVMGLKYETFDVYEHRGPKLRAKLESYLEKGNIHTIMYSNPNNPSWICFTEEELQIIGDMANKYDVSPEECQVRADERMQHTAMDLLKNQVKGYNSVRETGSNFYKHSGSYKYALYPVWILNTVWNGNKYVFAMNGQTGKLVGDVPYSKGKFFGVLFGVLAVIWAVLIGIVAATGNLAATGIVGTGVVALIVALLVAFSMKGKTKSVHKGTKALDFVVNGSFKLTNSFDNFLRKQVDKKPKQQKN